MATKSLNFNRDAILKDIIRRWWGSLQAHRGDRAELSRATSLEKVYECAAFYRLRKALEDVGYGVYPPALARTAAVLARIRRDRDGESFGVLLREKGVRYEDVKPAIRINDPDRLLRKLAGWVTRLKGEAPVTGTAELVYWWEVRRPNHEFLYEFFLNESTV